MTTTKTKLTTVAAEEDKKRIETATATVLAVSLARRAETKEGGGGGGMSGKESGDIWRMFAEMDKTAFHEPQTAQLPPLPGQSMDAFLAMMLSQFRVHDRATTVLGQEGLQQQQQHQPGQQYKIVLSNILNDPTRSYITIGSSGSAPAALAPAAPARTTGQS